MRKNKASTEYSACIHEGKAELASLALAYLWEKATGNQLAWKKSGKNKVTWSLLQFAFEAMLFHG